MSSGRIAQERTQRLLLELAAQPGNDVCADCKARHPRWASHNLGIFICVSCASIHRKMGTHISKVKSLSLDSWSKEQVETMKQIGNLKSNFVYNPNETRHPPPINAIDQERDSELEKFIRSKYEFKSYVDRSALVASKLGPSRSAADRLALAKSDTKLSPSSSISSSVSMASPDRQATQKRHPLASVLTHTAASPPTAASIPAKAPFRSFSQPVPPPLNLPVQAQSQTALGSSATFNDLAGLRTPESNASLPLQFAQPQYSAVSISSQMSIPTNTTSSPMSNTSGSPMTIPSSSSSSSFLTASSPYSNLSASPHSPFPSLFSQTTGISLGAPRSMSLGTGLNGLNSSTTGVSFNGAGTSPYHQTQFLPQPSPSPSPNPFASQFLPQTPGINGLPSSYSVTGQQPFLNQQQLMHQPTQMFSPQPQQQSLQVPYPGNPYLPTPSPQGSPFVTTTQFPSTTPSPYAMTQPLPYTGQPSPYVVNQSLPQMQMQQQQAQATNPFTSWIAQGPQQTGGYPPQQQWGGGM